MTSFTAVVEIPKGDDRRRHLNYEKSALVDLGPISEVIPVNSGKMPVDYGYIKGTKNPAEGDEVDVLILSEKIAAPGDEREIFPIALIKREDGDEKVVATDNEGGPVQKWEDAPSDLRALILEFFGYRHRILAIEGAEAARKYISETKTAQ